MIMEQRVTVAASREEVWAFLLNVPEMSVLVPGVERVQPTSETSYEGRMGVKVGPVSLRFDVVVTIDQLDETNYTAAMIADASDRRVGGSVRAKMAMVLQEPAPGSTEMVITTDLNLLGRLGQFGQPVIKKKADQVLEEFAANLRTRLAANA